MSVQSAFDDAVARHDARIAAAGQTIWLGCEPTFTDRQSQSPEWNIAAVGGDKEGRARALLAAMVSNMTGALILRSVGRRYPGEAVPHWYFGIYCRRDRTALWSGPPDPIVASAEALAQPLPKLEAWADAFARRLQEHQLSVWPVASVDRSIHRIVVRTDSVPPQASAAVWFERAPIDAPGLHPGGLRDELAESGNHLMLLQLLDIDGRLSPRVDLPMFDSVELLLRVLLALQAACADAGVATLVLAGYPPPVDAATELTSVTPDPAVIEINSAPCADASAFLACSRWIHDAAAAQRLDPYRLYFNGVVADSGGAGQITLGGPTARTSPFIAEPRLLPRLVRFFNRHPSLSYLFCHDFVGSSGQSVRSDERGHDAFDELVLALELLEHKSELAAESLWHSLASFLCDASGNSHRAELNIEKLWNPFLPGRGRLGLVEFRALRMQHTPERATAIACLLRAITAMLAAAPYDDPLIDWGRELHQRFALPFYLEQDLASVFASLDAGGFGLGEPIEQILWLDECRRWGTVDLPGCTVEVRQALEFWPLLGDAASPEQAGGSRMIDAGTARVELRLRPPRGEEGGGADWQAWQIMAGGVPLPMKDERDRYGRLRISGLRYRSFVPTWSLHPELPAQTPVQLRLCHPDQTRDQLLTLNEWRSDGSAYDGLPRELTDASRRRAERLTLEAVDKTTAPSGKAADVPAIAISGYGLDLRGLRVS